AEDGIRDKLVTGVQTCALPISLPLPSEAFHAPRADCVAESSEDQRALQRHASRDTRRNTTAARRHGARPGIERPAGSRRAARGKIGRASCRERGEEGVGGGSWR